MLEKLEKERLLKNVRYGDETRNKFTKKTQIKYQKETIHGYNTNIQKKDIIHK